MDNENYDGVMELIGEVIRQAVIDYMREVPPIEEGMTDSQVQKIKHWAHDKATAETFFKKSRLFKLTQIDLGWLIDQYNKGAFKYSPNDEEEDV